METPDAEKPYRDRMVNFVKDPGLEVLELKYQPYLDLHKIEAITDLFDIVQTAPNDALSGMLIWTTQRDLPIELKKDIVSIYNKHFVD